jgi:hypothetical protein
MYLATFKKYLVILKRVAAPSLKTAANAISFIDGFVKKVEGRIINFFEVCKTFLQWQKKFERNDFFKFLNNLNFSGTTGPLTNLCKQLFCKIS